MSLTLSAFAERVCYYLGYHKQRIEELESKLREAENKLTLLETEDLCIQQCERDGCIKWDVRGDQDWKIAKKDVVDHGGTPIWQCEECCINWCEDCAGQWILDPCDLGVLCEKCKN